MSDDVERFAAELERYPDSLARQARGIMAKHLDRAAGQARQAYLASRGTGTSQSAPTIRARMSRGRNEPVGYLLADGPGVFFHEHGGAHTPPRPVVRQAASGALPGIASDLADAAVNIR